MWSRGQLVIGATARALLTQPGFAGRVLAVVTDVVYLSAEEESRFLQENGILWLAQNHLPMHPRALRGDFDFSAMRVGMSFQSDGARLHFDVGDHSEGGHPSLSLRTGSGSPLQFADARVWQPATIDPARVVPRETVIARVRELREAMRGLDRTDFGKPVRSLKDARDLIGLGEGLTPSGDDFVGGWLFAVYHLHAAYPDAFDWEQRAIDELLDWARSRTNVISYALLRDHARGESVEPLHDWLVALLGVDEPGDMARLVARLIGIGSTTGKNILAGAATGMFLLAADEPHATSPLAIEIATLGRSAGCPLADIAFARAGGRPATGSRGAISNRCFQEPTRR